VVRVAGRLQQWRTGLKGSGIKRIDLEGEVAATAPARSARTHKPYLLSGVSLDTMIHTNI
jgi:hypothetical protein